MAEADRVRIAAVLAANPELQFGPRASPALDRDLDELPHPCPIEADERIALDQAFGEIFAEETCRVIAADAECGLGEVVGAEAEELRALRDLSRHQGRARQLDHGPDHVLR